MRPDHASPRRAHPNPGSVSAPQSPPLANPAPRHPPSASQAAASTDRAAWHPSLATSLLRTHRPNPSIGRRDSVGSIIDDPFFTQYDPAAPRDDAASQDSEGDSIYQSLSDEDDNLLGDRDRGLGIQPAAAAAGTETSQHLERALDGDEKNPNSYWPPPRRDSLTPNPSTYRSPPFSAMENFNIAVIGSTGVGKSSFVQRVLGLPRPPISHASHVRMSLDNVSHVITLLELDSEYFELNPSQPIQWPKQINGHIVPRVDAALVLYDVMNRSSVSELTQTLATLAQSGLPASLVACKCENPVDTWVVDVEKISNHPLFRCCVGTYKFSAEKPDVARMCLQTILRVAVNNRREEASETAVSRRRAQSAANLEALDPGAGRPMSQQSKHSRASSDFSLLRGFANPSNNDNYRPASRSPRIPQTASGTTAPGAGMGSGDQAQPQSVSSMLRTPGIRLDKPGTDSFLDVEESDAESYQYSEDIPILQRNDDVVLDKPAKVPGLSFDELVDRLLAPRLSRADHNFSDIFLCLYRKFAAPGELFSAIISRLDQVREDKNAHYLSRTATQLRMIEMVDKWVSLYPGDFARPLTRRNLEEFIRHLSTEPIFSIAAQHMRRNLHIHVVEDDDTGWANSDNVGDILASEILNKDVSELASSVISLQVEDDPNGRPSGSSEVSLVDRGNSIGSQFHGHDEYDREAALLEPTDNLPMNKFRYHIFMDIPDDDIADELTRIDWIMFSSIKIRDFVRHVSLSAAQKEKCKSLRNVNRMINHFNHIAKWVANMILLRDKPKHRAQILEKFMTIALKLRLLNNYNGLAAVLAGVNGTAIHRLAQTRGLVPPEVHKRFARLGILMGTQKSHFAYRLAWENSPLPRIPFIPLHRRDLVSAEEGSKTFVGPNEDRINWKKFEVLGEVLLPIMRSQGSSYPNLSKHDAARELILGCRMPTDEEDIYQRSVQVESISSGGLAEPAKKKFPWFAK